MGEIEVPRSAWLLLAAFVGVEVGRTELDRGRERSSSTRVQLSKRAEVCSDEFGRVQSIECHDNLISVQCFPAQAR